MPARPAILASLILAIGLAACAAPPAPTATLSATTVPQHLEPATPAPHATQMDLENLECATLDGATLAVTRYGHGATAVIFSNRSDKGRDSWADLPQLVAAAGYMALTYNYRAYRSDGNVDVAQLNLADVDLRGVIACAKLQGAQSIVLVGASLGGMASAREAAAAQPAALIIIGSPMSNLALTLRVAAADLQTNVPKLFIASENDSLVAASDTRAMYDAAAEPKTWHLYPGAAHGTDLLLGLSAQDLRQRVLDFIQAHAPA